MPGSTHCLMPRAVCHVAASGLRLSGEQECTRIGPDTCRLWTPTQALIKDRVCSVLEPWDPSVGGMDPLRGGGWWFGSHSRGPVCIRGCPRPTWRSRLYIQGSDTFPWGSEPTVDTLEYISFSGHVAAPEPPMWWGQVLLLAQSSRPRLG
jgi:hypothetical protein